jgi:hypothetical protein
MVRLCNKRLLCVVLLACAVAACDDEVPTSPSDPPPAVTDTFTGTIAASGAATHSFSTAGGGTVTGTLKTIGPDSALVVSFALGTWTGSACSVVLANDKATTGAVLSGTMTGVGSLCTRVSDVGNIPAGTSVSYTIEVVHP